MPAKLNYSEILELKFDHPDLGKGISIRQYLYTLLYDLWNQGEGFDSKRPFGDSNWRYDLYHPLVREGIVYGSLDDKVLHIYSADRIKADLLVDDLIKAMCLEKA